jgi:CelD/BcsL family acetyltransferase involved in cellulose biosynthesis
VLGARALRRTASPVMHIGGRSWDELCAARSRGFRDKARRGERRLRRDHEVRWRTTGRRGELEADLDHLFRLHGERWGGRATTFAGADRALKRRFAAVALERGWLRLRLLELDGHPAAAFLNYRFGNAELHYQAGRDPAYARYGLGFALHCHAIRSAIAEGAERYLLLRGDEAYKRRFADEDAGVVSVGVVREGAPAEAQRFLDRLAAELSR